MITREAIEGLFLNTRRLRAEGRVKWDVDQACRWSYFFVDSSRDKLMRAVPVLVELGYESRGLLDPAPENDDQETLYLRVDRLEQHSVESLCARCRDLSAVADRLGLHGFDGMDVGAVNGP